MNFINDYYQQLNELLARAGLKKKTEGKGSFEQYFIYGNQDVAIKVLYDTRDQEYNITIMKTENGVLPSLYDSENTILISYYLNALVSLAKLDINLLHRKKVSIKDIINCIENEPQLFTTLNMSAFLKSISQRDLDYEKICIEFEERFIDPK